MGRKKIDPLLRERVVRETMSEEADVVAKRHGLDVSTVRRWKRDAEPAPVTPGAPPVAETVPEPTEKTSPLNDGDVPGPGGFNAAANAMGTGAAPPPVTPVVVGPAPARDGSAAPPPPVQAPPSPPPTTEVFIRSIEVCTMTVMRVYAARYKVPWTPNLHTAAQFTKEEYVTMETYAPYAMPLFQELLLKYGKYIGGGLFAMVYWYALTDRLKVVRALAPEQEEEKDGAPPKPKAPPPESRKNDLRRVEVPKAEK